MAKKYTPSGYQIIYIDTTGLTIGTPFTPRTEDEEILMNLLSNGANLRKPILLQVKETLSYDETFSGFGVVKGNVISLNTYSPDVRFEFTSSNGKLEFAYYD